MKIVLVRHGISVANVAGLLVGWTDSELSKEGIAGLQEIQKSTPYPKTDVYYCSDLMRCRQTLQILYPEVKEVIYKECFREVYYGCFEGLSNKILNFRALFDEWLNYKTLKDEEKRADFQKRVNEGLKNVVRAGHSSATIVTHTGVIKQIYLSLLKLDDDHYFKVKVLNGKGFILDVDLIDDELVLNHLEPLE